MSGQFFHVPGCGCSLEGAPLNNERDDACREWTAITEKWLTAHVNAELEAAAVAVEEERLYDDTGTREDDAYKDAIRRAARIVRGRKAQP